jgi:hypothetical protein
MDMPRRRSSRGNGEDFKHRFLARDVLQVGLQERLDRRLLLGLNPARALAKDDPGAKRQQQNSASHGVPPTQTGGKSLNFRLAGTLASLPGCPQGRSGGGTKSDALPSRIALKRLRFRPKTL